ncbi:MAG: TlpA family protein disulfide reductase [bacterium]|nr:TlpA family protein disulfide reductase [bacterium]
MRLAILFFCLVMTYSVANGQGILDDPNAIFLNVEGKTLSREQAGEMLYSQQRYRLDKDNTKVPGKVLVTLVPITQKEFDKIIAANQKSVKGLKGKKMSDFELPGLDGNMVSSESMEGKIVVYNFWFTSCRPCIEELPQLNELVEKYGDRITFVAPTFNDKAMVDKFLKRREFKYQILTDGNDLSKEMNITSYPTHLVVDEKGIIRKVFIGANQFIGQKLDSAIKSL